MPYNTFNIFYVTGGVYYALYMALLISKLFVERAFGGWGGVERGVWVGGGGSEYIKLLYDSLPPPPPPLQGGGGGGGSLGPEKN